MNHLLDPETDNLNGVKRDILNSIVKVDDLSITNISREINTSVPTVTKFLGELIAEGYVIDNGKTRIGGGRRPSTYSLNAAKGYIIGIDITRDYIKLGLMDFKGVMEGVVTMEFEVLNSRESLEQLCKTIEAYIKKSKLAPEKLLSVSLSLSGRVDSQSGFSYTMFSFGEEPVVDIMSKRLGCTVYIENDSRAMVYGEYMCGVGRGEDTFIFANLSWGFGIGMIINGRLFYGKSGFSGEYGHLPIANNEILCQCGKLGCTETVLSGWTTRQKFIEQLKLGRASSLSQRFKETGDVTLHEIMEAACNEDTLAIDVIENIGESLGHALSGLINIFNPEMIVIGGSMFTVKDYLMTAVSSAIKKYSLKLVSRDTVIMASELGENAAVVGACMLARSKMLGLI